VPVVIILAINAKSYYQVGTFARSHAVRA